jgi:uncharacterized membrane protein
VAAISPAEPSNDTTSGNNITFRWIYVILPVVFLLLSIILIACFYHRLPPDVAYHFSGGTPDSWTGRSAIIAWLLVPQFVLAMLSFAVVRTAIYSTRYWSAEGTPLKKMLIFMGNMVVLPQLILIFAMLDIFLYNAYQIRLIPLWVFALIILVLGAIILGIFFIQTIWQVRRLRGKSLQE